MERAGLDVTVVDAGSGTGDRPYRVFSAFSTAGAERLRQRLKRHANGRVKTTVGSWGAARKRARSGRPSERGRLATAGNVLRLIVLSLLIALTERYRQAVRRMGGLVVRVAGPPVSHVRGFLRLLRTRADVVIATRPSAAIPACLAAGLRHARFVYYPFELYALQHATFSPTVAATERLLLRHRVDAVVTQNEERARVYVAERGCRVPPVVVRNYKPRRHVDAAGRLRPTLGLDASTRIVLYEGQLVRGRWLDRLMRSIRYLPPDIQLVLMGPRKGDWWTREGEPLYTELSATGRIAVVDAVPHDELLEHIADADVGVVIYDDSVRNNYYCAPGKLSDYVFANVPLVAPDFPTIGPTITELGIGALFGPATPESIAQAIMRVLAFDPTTIRTALATAQKRLTWETQEATLLDAIAPEATHRPAARPGTQSR